MPAGWSLTAKSCAKASGPVGSAIANGVSVDVAGGDDITCTFEDKRLPKLTVIKTVINDNGGQAEASDWNIYVKKSGGSNVAGSPKPGSAGRHVHAADRHVHGLREHWPRRLRVRRIQRRLQPNPGGSVTLDYGDDVTCTLTNNDQPGRIVIIKNAKPANGTFTFNTTGSTSGPGHGPVAPRASR